MDYTKTERIKVVWLCHFVNQEMKDYFGNQDISNFAPWISELISIFKNKEAIELHIIAPNAFTNDDVIFLNNNIYYHFYKIKNFQNVFTRILTNGYLTNFIYVKRKVRKFINQIQPDIIHLHGAENPYYSATILPLLNKYPTLVTIQGFASKEMINSLFHTIRYNIEKNILKNANHFGYRADFMPEYLRKFSPKANFYFHLYPINSKIKNINLDPKQAKKYDIVFYGRVCKDKGIEDLIEAVRILINQNLKIKILVVGNPSLAYGEYLRTLIQTKNIQNNFTFVPYFSTQIELFEAIMESKICVLPTHADIFPFTISESMFLKVPVISYNIEGVNDFNKNGQYIYMIKEGDIKQLADAIDILLSDESKRIKQADNAYNFINTQFDENVIFDNLFNAYISIMQI